MEKCTYSWADSKAHTADGVTFTVKQNLRGLRGTLAMWISSRVCLDVDGNLPTHKINVYSVADTLLVFRMPDVKAMWPVPLRISNLVGETVVNNVCCTIDGFAVLDTPATLFKFWSRLPKPEWPLVVHTWIAGVERMRSELEGFMLRIRFQLPKSWQKSYSSHFPVWKFIHLCVWNRSSQYFQKFDLSILKVCLTVIKMVHELCLSSFSLKNSPLGSYRGTELKGVL